MPEIKYSDNKDDFIAQLRRAGFDLQTAAVMAINNAAHKMTIYYQSLLKNKTNLRAERFTLNAVKIYKATPRSSGKGKPLRKLENINAIVGIGELRGKEHYLAKMEEGGQKKGGVKTGGRVPIPMDTARGGDRKAPILNINRLLRKTPSQFQNQLSKAKNPRQQYAILYSMARSGKIKAGMYQSENAIYAVTKDKVIMVRKTEDSTILVKSRPLFAQMSKHVTPDLMDKYFINAAKQLLSDLM